MSAENLLLAFLIIGLLILCFVIIFCSGEDESKRMNEDPIVESDNLERKAWDLEALDAEFQTLTKRLENLKQAQDKMSKLSDAKIAAAITADALSDWEPEK